MIFGTIRQINQSFAANPETSFKGSIIGWTAIPGINGRITRLRDPNITRSALMTMAPPAAVLSIVTPAYNEAKILPELYRRIHNVLENVDITWEWIVVDDCSQDGTRDVVQELMRRDERIRTIRFARNHGAHLGILCGFQRARRCCNCMRRRSAGSAGTNPGNAIGVAQRRSRRLA